MISFRCSTSRARQAGFPLQGSRLAPLLIGLCCALLPCAGGTSEGPAESARRVLDRGDYQTELPFAPRRSSAQDKPDPAASAATPESAAPAGAPESGAPGATPAPSGRSVETRSAPVSSATADIVRFLVYGLLIAVVLLFFSVLGRDVFDRWVNRRRPESAQGGIAPPDTLPWTTIALEDVEEHASSGRFSEAVHLLLARVFTQLLSREGKRLRPSWTGREVLRQVSLQDEARESLRSLIHVVELSYFGGRVVAREDYEGSRRAYDRLVAALSA